MANVAVDRDESKESTSVRIMAFLQKTRILPGLVRNSDFEQGFNIVQRMALDVAHLGTADPPTRLTLGECAMVLEFLSQVEPVKPGRFYSGNAAVSPHCGYILILHCLEANLRSAARRRH